MEKDKQEKINKAMLEIKKYIATIKKYNNNEKTQRSKNNEKNYNNI